MAIFIVLVFIFLAACVGFLFGRTFGVNHAYYIEKERARKNRSTVYRPNRKRQKEN